MKQNSSFSIIPIGIALILLGIIIGLLQSLFHIIGRQNLLKTRKNDLTAIQTQTETLKQKLNEVDKPIFVEREARDKLNMARNGETVILIDKTNASAEPQNEQQPASPAWKTWWELFF